MNSVVSLPIDPKDVAERLGIDVKPLDVDIEGLDGLYYKGHGTYIYYNPFRSVNTQRLTIGHELGHAVAGYADPRSWKETPRNAPTELACDAFALKTLMPNVLVRATVREIGANIPALAELFGVDHEAAEKRLQTLGITKNVKQAA